MTLLWQTRLCALQDERDLCENAFSCIQIFLQAKENNAHVDPFVEQLLILKNSGDPAISLLGS